MFDQGYNKSFREQEKFDQMMMQNYDKQLSKQ